MIVFLGTRDLFSGVKVEDVVQQCLIHVLTSYPRARHDIEVIRGTEKDQLVEYTIFSDEDNSPLFHAFFRIYLTSSGAHCLSLKRYNNIFTQRDRRQWLRAFQKQVSIQPWKRAKKLKKISLAGDNKERPIGQLEWSSDEEKPVMKLLLD